MIARIWRCRVSQDNAPRYVEHFRTSVLPELQHLTGFQEATILQHPFEDGLELTVMTVWASMEAVRGFAGDDVERAVVEPIVETITHSFDKTVTHSDMIFAVRGPMS